MRPILLLLAIAAPAASKDEYVDEVHPRSPGSPLEIVFEPWYCNLCAVEGRVPAQDEGTIEMRRMLCSPIPTSCRSPRTLGVSG